VEPGRHGDWARWHLADVTYPEWASFTALKCLCKMQTGTCIAQVDYEPHTAP